MIIKGRYCTLSYLWVKHRKVFSLVIVTSAVETGRSWPDREMLPLLSCSQIWKQEVPDRKFDFHENICSKIISRLTGWCWRGCAWHAGTASWTKAFSPSSAALESSVGPKCSLKFDKFLVYNSRQSEYDNDLLIYLFDLESGAHCSC